MSEKERVKQQIKFWRARRDTANDFLKKAEERLGQILREEQLRNQLKLFDEKENPSEAEDGVSDRIPAT